MILYPAIDLKDGQVVRLQQGRFDAVTVYYPEARLAAERWVKAGAPWLHVVDLNGALEGTPANRAVIAGLVKEFKIPIQVGGGLRDRDTVSAYLDLGVARVVIGTKALEDPEFVPNLTHEFPGKIAVGLDAKDGFVAVRGWVEQGTVRAVDLAKKLGDWGAAAVIYTDIARDGMLTGPNYEGLQTMAAQSPVPVIASGGIANIEDIRRLKSMEHTGIQGAILGRSLYENTLDLKAALELANAC